MRLTSDAVRDHDESEICLGSGVPRHNSNESICDQTVSEKRRVNATWTWIFQIMLMVKNL